MVFFYVFFMKLSFAMLFLSAMCIGATTYGQIIDKESHLRTRGEDTLTGWRRGGYITLNFSQTSLTNWAAGGQSSVSGNSLISLFLKYRKGKATWDNTFDLGYGLLKQGENTHLIKTDDKIEILSKYGRQAFSDFYYAGLLNLRTQMAPGYNYPNDSVKISNFFAPGYILGAVGLDYKPNTYFSFFVAPVTAKITVVADQFLADAGAFGVKPAVYDNSGNRIEKGESVREEIGGYIRVMYSRNDFKSEFFKNITFTTKLDLFSNYLRNPQNIDVNWETLIAMKVNKYISVNLNTQLIYDDDIKIPIDRNKDGIIDQKGPRIQFKEILGVGFSVKF